MVSMGGLNVSDAASSPAPPRSGQCFPAFADPLGGERVRRRMPGMFSRHPPPFPLPEPHYWNQASVTPVRPTTVTVVLSDRVKTVFLPTVWALALMSAMLMPGTAKPRTSSSGLNSNT